MILLIDNYDSFTHNLVQSLRMEGAEVQVVAHDACRASDLAARRPTGVVISPGPGRPCDAGISEAAVAAFLGQVPLLGVCLGHQALCTALGGRVVHAGHLMHGRTSSIRHDGTGLFRGLPEPFEAARYHSLAVAPGSLPDCLRACAWADDGELMAVRHRLHPAFGVQFHPESFMTGSGSLLIRNFVALTVSAPHTETAHV